MDSNEHVIDYRCHQLDDRHEAEIASAFADQPVKMDRLLTAIQRPRLAYFIYDGDQPFDGEFLHGTEQCIKRLGYLMDNQFVDFRVYALDMQEARRDGSTRLQDVTAELVRLAWESGDLPSYAALAQEYVPEARRDHGRDPNAEHRTFTHSRGESL